MGSASGSIEGLPPSAEEAGRGEENRPKNDPAAPEPKPTTAPAEEEPTVMEDGEAANTNADGPGMDTEDLEDAPPSVRAAILGKMPGKRRAESGDADRHSFIRHEDTFSTW